MKADEKLFIKNDLTGRLQIYTDYYNSPLQSVGIVRNVLLAPQMNSLRNQWETGDCNCIDMPSTAAATAATHYKVWKIPIFS
jgi:hypothetical protein